MHQWPVSKISLSNGFSDPFWGDFKFETFSSGSAESFFQKTYEISFLSKIIPLFFLEKFHSVERKFVKAHFWHTPKFITTATWRANLTDTVRCQPPPLVWLQWHGQFNEPCTHHDSVWHILNRMWETLIKTRSMDSAWLKMWLQEPLHEWFISLLFCAHNLHFSTKIWIIQLLEVVHQPLFSLSKTILITLSDNVVW